MFPRLILLLLCLPLLSCSPDAPDAPDRSDESAILDSTALAGVKDFLGKGYKGYEYYADPRSITTALFDTRRHAGVEVQTSPSYEGHFVYGQSRKTYFDALSGSIGLSGAYGGFSGEVTASFNKQTLTDSNNVYATSNVTQAYYRLSLNDAAQLLPAVQQDIAGMDPRALFEKYGTHYLKSFYVGARISFSSHADTSRVSKNFDANATVKAAYSEVVKGVASGGSVTRKDVEEVIRNKHVRVMGGDPAKAHAIVEGLGESSANYSAWSASVPDNMSIADFASGGLVPIYELAATAERRGTLLAAWNAYMDAHTDDLLQKDDPKPVVVTKNSKLRLLSSDDRYIAKADPAPRYYYAQLGQSGVTLQLGGNDKPLIGGSVITIKTTESFKKGWEDYNLLGAFGDATELYYWNDYGSKSNWIFEKINQDEAGQPFHFGEQVYIRNEAYSDQYLAPYKNNYLTTTKQGKHKWRIVAVE